MRIMRRTPVYGLRSNHLLQEMEKMQRRAWGYRPPVHLTSSPVCSLCHGTNRLPVSVCLLQSISVEDQVSEWGATHSTRLFPWDKIKCREFSHADPSVLSCLSTGNYNHMMYFYISFPLCGDGYNSCKDCVQNQRKQFFPRNEVLH